MLEVAPPYIDTPAYFTNQRTRVRPSLSSAAGPLSDLSSCDPVFQHYYARRLVALPETML
jgi:hypothetical protein